MISRTLISILLTAITAFFMHLVHIRWDPVFVILIFMNFKSSSVIWPCAGIGYCILWDHLIAGSFPFFSIAGLIIFGSAIWLRAAYPIIIKPLTVIMAPIYTQFLWFLLLFGYFINEGTGASAAGYLAPFIFGNSVMTFVLAVVVYWVLPSGRRRDFAPGLLS